MIDNLQFIKKSFFFNFLIFETNFKIPYNFRKELSWEFTLEIVIAKSHLLLSINHKRSTTSCPYLNYKKYKFIIKYFNC